MSDIKLNSFIKGMILLTFMLFAVDFLGYGWYILAVSFVLLGIYLMATGYELKFDNQFLFVAFLAIVNYITILSHSSVNIIVLTIKYLFSPICGYLIGTAFVAGRKAGDSILKLYMYAAIPYFIHGFLNIFVFEGFVGFEREVPDFWTGELWKATLACTYFIMTVSLLFVAFIAKGFARKLAYIFGVAFSIYATVITASRTVLLIGLITLVFSVYLYKKDDSDEPKSEKVLSRLFGILVLLAVVAIFFLESIKSLDFYSRLTNSSLSEEPRIVLFMNVIKNTWKYPFGNMPYFYSHNTWLDFLRVSGWIPFALFCGVTVIAYKNVVSIYNNKSIVREHRIAVCSIMLALALGMFVEPVMDGAAILFCLIFYLFGVNNQFAKLNGSEINVKNAK